MKSTQNFIRGVLFLLLIACMGVSCNNDDDTPKMTGSISMEDAMGILDSYNVSSEVSFLANSISQDPQLLSKSGIGKKIISDCISSALIMNEATDQIILDFGDGCTTDDGTNLKGKLIMEFEIDYNDFSMRFIISYEDFMIDDMAIEGGQTFATEFDDNLGDFSMTITFDTTITYPDNSKVVSVGSQTMAMTGIDGASMDDIGFSISGEWEFTNREGSNMGIVITEPLVLKPDCMYIVSGIIEITKDGEKGGINFGDGNCDNKALFTDGTGTVEISLDQ